MKPELQKQSSDEKSEGRRSITKYLAVATMAASLGVSLGVPVVDALAADSSSPPSVKQQKIKGQTDQSKQIGSQQHKESNQLKLKQKQSNQLKLKQNVGTTAGQGQVNK